MRVGRAKTVKKGLPETEIRRPHHRNRFGSLRTASSHATVDEGDANFIVEDCAGHSPMAILTTSRLFR
jgi:hypothetical protein